MLWRFFIRPKNLYRLRKRCHYWFCRLFVVFSTSPVNCFERDWERSNALRNFWLVLYLKINNNLADDSIGRLFYYWRTCKQQLTQPNKLVLQKTKLNSPCPPQTSPSPSSQAPPRDVQWCHDAASRNFRVPGDGQIIKIELTTEIIIPFFRSR